MRLYVPGNKILLPNISPAPPAITIADISNVPCNQMDIAEVNNKPFLKKKY